MMQWSEPNIGKEEKQAVLDLFESGWLSQGKKTAEFEKALASYIGCKHVVAMNNGTSALLSGLLAHGIGRGDEVIVPTLTFIATVNAVIATGATPVLADSDPDTWNISPSTVEKKITSKTKAIIPVDVGGLPVDVVAFRQICASRGLILIEDSAEALGAEYRGKRIGSFGHTCIFSFHMAKQLSTVEGGCVCTNDDTIAHSLRGLRNHGADQIVKRDYNYPSFGLNLRTTDIQSAIGIAQLAKLESVLQHRKQLASLYMQELGNRYTYQSMPSYATRNPYMFFGIIDKPGKRESTLNRLEKAAIPYRICWKPAHLQPYHQHLFHGSYPNAECIASSIINVPMGNNLTEEDVLTVCRALKNDAP